jgi:hypothetical protein
VLELRATPQHFIKNMPQCPKYQYYTIPGKKTLGKKFGKKIINKKRQETVCFLSIHCITYIPSGRGICRGIIQTNAVVLYSINGEAGRSGVNGLLSYIDIQVI